MTLNNLSNNKNIFIQNSDEGNSVALLDKHKYHEGLSELLNNITKFELLQFDDNKELNYILNLKKKIINFLTNLKNK